MMHVSPTLRRLPVAAHSLYRTLNDDTNARL
jgi:hypothetical protein